MTKYKAKVEMENGHLVTLRFTANNKQEVTCKINDNYKTKYILSIDEVGNKNEKIEFKDNMSRNSYPYIKNSNGKSIRIFG